MFIIKIIKASAQLSKIKEAIAHQGQSSKLSAQYCQSLSMRPPQDISNIKLLSKHQDLLQVRFSVCWKQK